MHPLQWFEAIPCLTFCSVNSIWEFHIINRQASEPTQLVASHCLPRHSGQAGPARAQRITAMPQKSSVSRQARQLPANWLTLSRYTARYSAGTPLLSFQLKTDGHAPLAQSGVSAGAQKNGRLGLSGYAPFSIREAGECFAKELGSRHKLFAFSPYHLRWPT